MGRLKKVRFGFFKEQKGISLVETVMVLGLLGIIGAAFASALWTISRNTGIYNERVTASSLAQSQVEEIKDSEYSATGGYLVSVDPPSGFSVSLSAFSEPGQEDTKQEITVAVSHGGKGIVQIKIIKTNWR